jgi:hypothetical protein
MTTFKTVNTDYTLTCNDGAGIFTINAANTIFNGNMTYTGNLTTVDDFIVVAANNTGTVQDMGLLAGINAGTNLFAGLRFDVATNSWQVSSNVNGLGVGSYSTILTSTASGNAAGSNTQVQFNDSGAFAANANLTYDYVNSRLTLQGVEVYGNIGTTPSYAGNGVAVYNNTIGDGGTGLYVKNSQVNDELVSKSKAIVYGIIF